MHIFHNHRSISLVNQRFLQIDNAGIDFTLLEKRRFASPDLRRTETEMTQKGHLRRTRKRVRRTSCVNEHQMSYMHRIYHRCVAKAQCASDLQAHTTQIVFADLRRMFNAL